MSTPPQSSCTEEFPDGKEVQRALGSWEQLGRVRQALSLESESAFRPRYMPLGKTLTLSEHQSLHL